MDGEQLLAELASMVGRFVSLPEGAATAIVLWLIFAHAHDAASVSTIIGATSPEKRCGKTTLMTLLGALVPRPLPASNISAAALFRAVEKYRPTLLIDEADTFLRERQELRGILNAGHTRAGAFVVRCEGDEHAVREFSTWAPKAIAMIGRLPNTLADRSIEIRMHRRGPSERVERLRADRLHAAFEPLRRRVARWAGDHLDALRDADPDVPVELHDRAADNWRPLLAIADLVGGIWPERARKAALLLAGTDEGEDTAAILLLRDLRDLFEQRGTDRLAGADIVETLVEMDERPWPEWRRGKPLTARALARLLRPFGIAPGQMKLNGANVRGYARGAFEDAWSRYLPESATPLLSPAPLGISAEWQTLPGGEGSDPGIPEDARPASVSSGVADGEAPRR